MALTNIEWTITRLPEGFVVDFMGQLTSILPGYTFNPWWGCVKVSRACKNCYAEYLSDHRMKGNHWGPKSSRRMFGDEHWKKPLQWNALAKSLGVRLKVFCASMGDVFEDHPDVMEARQRLWKLIDATPHLNWLLLTKRPENILSMLPVKWVPAVAIINDTKPKHKTGPIIESYIPNSREHHIPDNVWFGTTVEDQETYHERIKHLVRVPGVVRFLSIEPQAGPINLHLPGTMPGKWFPRYTNMYQLIHWVINGGESGNKAEPSHPDWFRGLRDQCKEFDIPYFFKQWGEWAPQVDGKKFSGQVMSFKSPTFQKGNWLIKPPDVYHYMAKVGKKNAGRLLDGREHNDMPTEFFHSKLEHPKWIALPQTAI